ncbi:MAG: helix-turn-helix transcriptional regulator [Rhodospirillaceae bacterium]
MKRRTRGKGESTNEVDVLVGQRLRELRMLAGLSQSDLAATIGLTFQQLQKYERGVNRISASKLFLLARYLNVPVSALFSDLDGGKPSETPTDSESLSPAGEPGDPQLRSREALVLARHFMRIRDANARSALKAFIEACAGIGFAEGRTGLRRPEGDGAGGDGARRTRRPRGVVWHPTDISRG